MSLRVLIVDDEPIVRRLHETSLTGWGYQVISASGGEQAWEIFQRPDAPSLAILDWTMPGMDGLELCTRVRSLGREPKPYIIFVTAKARTQDIVAGLSAGADGIALAPAAAAKLARFEALGFGRLPVCVAKTQNSLSDDPKRPGRPRGFTVTIRDAALSAGAGFVVVYAGDILTMPGLPKVPGAETIDIDATGNVVGLF